MGWRMAHTLHKVLCPYLLTVDSHWSPEAPCPFLVSDTNLLQKLWTMVRVIPSQPSAPAHHCPHPPSSLVVAPQHPPLLASQCLSLFSASASSRTRRVSSSRITAGFLKFPTTESYPFSLPSFPLPSSALQQNLVCFVDYKTQLNEMFYLNCVSWVDVIQTYCAFYTQFWHFPMFLGFGSMPFLIKESSTAFKIPNYQSDFQKFTRTYNLSELSLWMLSLNPDLIKIWDYCWHQTARTKFQMHLWQTQIGH